MYEYDLNDYEISVLHERLADVIQTFGFAQATVPENAEEIEHDAVEKLWKIARRFSVERRGLQPATMSTAELGELLRDMARRVETGDSDEGSIMYLFPEMPPMLSEDEWADLPEDERKKWRAEDESTMRYVPAGYEYDPNAREVTGSFRIGNEMGQGGVRLVGTVKVVDAVVEHAADAGSQT